VTVIRFAREKLSDVNSVPIDTDVLPKARRPPGFNPTNFYAVRIQPPHAYENREDAGIQAQRAGGVRPEVSHDLVHEVPIQDTERERDAACA
jgi:hypothetical protein